MSGASCAPAAPLFLFNGAAGQCLRVAQGRIAEPEPAPGDLHLDLRGDRLLPGLVNAHDHLQLNGLQRLHYRPQPYRNVREWIADITPRLDTEAGLRAYRALPRARRLRQGALKNLLSGVTTVAHHDPGDAALQAPDFPVNVPPLAWSHSLGLDGEAAVAASQREAPTGQPWIIHAAEGLDAEAAAEFDRLEALGCITARTVLVHGLALDEAQQQRLLDAQAGLVCCLGSNRHLFGRVPRPRRLLAAGRVALGSDSRISGERDLLAELALARETWHLPEAELERLVTAHAAALLRLPDAGHLRPGARADLLVLPGDLPLSRASRADLRLVLAGGRPRHADAAYAALLQHRVDWRPARLDGRPRALAADLGWPERALAEPGLEA